MNKASERYYTKVEIPISVILETIFSDDNKDVETLCRWAKHYGYVDLIKENGDKLGYYKLQDDYTKQSFYVLLDKEERKQYDYEDYLLDELQRKDNIINEVKDIINKMIYVGYCVKTGKGTAATNFMAVGEQSEFGTRAKYILDKIKEIENK